MAGIAVWVATAPDTVATADHVGTLVPIAAGESYYEGYYALNDRDITVERIAPVATAGVLAEPLLCTPASGEGYVGNITSADLDTYCAATEPLAAGTFLPGHEPGTSQPYVLVRITKHTDTTEAFCGLDITYRAGWRRGTNRQGGTHQVLLTQDEIESSSLHWSDFANCPVGPGR